MSQKRRPSDDDQPHGDPWAAFGLVVSGVGFYGVVGWLLDRWLDTTFLVAIGIVLGAVLGIYATYARFTAIQHRHAAHDQQRDDAGAHDDSNEI